METKTLTDSFSWPPRSRWRARARKAGRWLAVGSALALVGYLAQFWWVHSGHSASFAQWTRRRAHVEQTEHAYQRAFDRAFQRLRADRNARLLRYEFPLAALPYQQAAASGWRLQSHQAVLAGIAVPRAYRGWLDDQGILFIDPRLTPEKALANPGTPLPLAVLQRDFLLVPDLTGARRHAYQIVALRQLSMKR